MDDDGLIPEALRQTIAHLRGQGRRIKFLYTIPNFHNPAGVTLSARGGPRSSRSADRTRSSCSRTTPTACCTSTSRPPNALRSLDRGRDLPRLVLEDARAGFPGRLGARPARDPREAHPRRRVGDPLAVVVQPARGVGVPVAGRLARRRSTRSAASTASARTRMIEALGEYLPQLWWTNPNGGFYVWVTMPDVLDSKQMLPRAVKELVAYTPGTAFFADGRGRHAMRLSFCYPTPEAIRSASAASRPSSTASSTSSTRSPAPARCSSRRVPTSTPPRHPTSSSGETPDHERFQWPVRRRAGGRHLPRA